VLQNEQLDELVIEALAKANAHDVVGFIDQLMGETRSEVQRGGAAVLGKIADPKAEGLLVAWLDTRNPTMRAEVIGALGQLGTVRARDALTDCLADPNEQVRLATLQALSTLPGTVSALMRLCQDPSTRVRERLARSVGESRSLESMRVAEALIADPDFEVRTEALKSLLLLGDWGAVERFIEHFAKQPVAMQQRLKELPAEHPVLKAQADLVLNSRHPEAREVALKALAQLDKRPLPVMLQALSDPDPRVRVAAVEAVGYSQQPALRAAVDRLLRDPVAEVQEAARRGRMLVIDGDKD
jgi:HEAT repeat protein